MLLQNAETVRLATAQGGSVSLTSLKPGARFVFFLPHYIRRLDTTLTTPSISHRRSYRPLHFPCILPSPRHTSFPISTVEGDSVRLAGIDACSHTTLTPDAEGSFLMRD